MTDNGFHLQNQVLQFMAAHGAPTAQQIADHFGKDLHWAQQTIRNLQRRGFIFTRSVTYGVNASGAAAMVKPMKCTPAKRARAKEERSRAAMRDTFKPAGHDFDGIVAQGKSQPNSVFAMGARHG